MAMRLVWPDEDTMPKKRKDNGAAETAPAEELVDGPVEAVDEEAAAPVAIEGEEEVEESGELPEVDLAILEAMLFSTHHPLTGQRVGELLEIKSQKAIKRAVQALNE